MKATARQEEILKRHLPDYWKGQIDTNNPLITSIIKAMNEVERTPVVVERTVYRYKDVSLPSEDEVAAACWKTVSDFRNANDNVHHMLGFLEGGKWVISELEKQEETRNNEKAEIKKEETLK